MPTSIGSTPGYTQENSEITAIPIDEGLNAWLPLDISNTWIYSYTAYINNDHATWRVSDTVIDVQERSGYTIARIQREVTLISDQTSVNFPDEPVSDLIFHHVLDLPLGNLDARNRPVVAHPAVGKAEILQYPLGRLDRFEFLLGYLLAVGKPRSETGVRGLVPGG